MITNLTPEQKWEQATIANNFLFYKIMRNNPDVCRELLEILLEIKIQQIQIHTEEEISIDYESKGIRLDVYALNESQAFNIEMQVLDTKELPERARYYQGVMDIDNLKSGEPYKKLKTSYVIFICLSDIFNKGLPLYSFENLCRENKELKLNDRTFKYFYIASNCDKLLNKEQRAFFKLITENTSTSKFTEKMTKLTKDAKHNLQWRRQYMEWERQRTYDFNDGFEKGIEQGIEQGIEKGITMGKQKQEETVINLLRMNIGTPEQIASATDLPLEQVLELQKQITVNA